MQPHTDIPRSKPDSAGDVATLLRGIGRTRRRELGAYFTSPALAEALLAPMSRTFTQDSTILDPACGAGDLLLAAGRVHPRLRQPHSQPAAWSHLLRGFDVFPDFVQLAKSRLHGVACPCTDDHRTEAFPHIHQRDFLADPSLDDVSHVIMNPPFGYSMADPGIDWASGRVSTAAVFIDIALQHASRATRVAAILPEVLRTGSRYEAWRRWVARLADVETIRPVGRFAPDIDVDVFFMYATTKGSASKLSVDDCTAPWKPTDTPPMSSTSKLGEKAEVHVGPVVPHRAPNRGPWTRYLDVSGAPAGGEVDVASLRRRRWNGRTFDAPFVVVRRTSSPHDAGRAVATLVTGAESIAVENHLLVLTPAEHVSAADLIRCLTDSRTTDWLNSTMRLRHLTVGSIAEIPWWQR